jgi:ABC-type bacteriocin/lantibiotic exporter with double-glycine peptidase domain
MATSRGKGRPVMTPHMKIGIAGVIIGLILLIINPWLALAVIVLAVAIPGIAYAMLDSNQKARLRGMRRRKQLGR